MAAQSAKARAALAVVLTVASALAMAPTTFAADRAIEHVTPPDDLSYFLEPIYARADGASVYWSTAVNNTGGDNAPADLGQRDVFISRRGSAGWSLAWLTPFVANPESGESIPGFQVGRDAEGVVFSTTVDLVPEDDNDVLTGTFADAFIQPVYDVYRGTERGVRLISAPPGGPTGVHGLDDTSASFTTSSADLTATAFITRSPMLPSDEDEAADIYLRTEDGLELVSTLVDGSSTPAFASIPTTVNRYGVDRVLHGAEPLSDDGRSLVFRSAEAFDPVADADTEDDLYLWRDGEVSLISDSRRAEPDCAGVPAACAVNLVGMARDASVIYLGTQESLLDEDVDGNAFDVYAYRPSGASLELVTGAGTAPVMPITVTPQGQLFFTTADRLGADPPPPGPTNAIYRWDGADLATVAVMDPADDPDDIYGENAATTLYREARATPDGSAFLFGSVGAFDPLDTDGGEDLYLWREDRGLTRVSGNGPGLASFFYTTTASASAEPTLGRVLSSDGSRVFFNSRDRLTADAADDGATKVYEWEEGAGISLVAGRLGEEAHYVDSSADGATVFFRTGAKLAATDIDAGDEDLYAARIGGEFPQPPVVPTCDGDGCQGAYRPPPPLVAASSSRLDAPDRRSPQPAFSVVKLTRGQQARLARGGRVGLRVRVNGPGAVRVVARSAVGGQRRIVARGVRRASRRGAVQVPLKLSRPALRALSRNRRLRVAVAVRFSGASKPRTLSLHLRGGATSRRPNSR